ncbi:SusC/RagA family TonB-linked outer membrane protein [Pedobacter sp. SYSU D00535]|uniref:SusC/RagA family TonB-linked outer membrane protein n=1 Tax=Pedobacter sp. SYSU D00535 TaxID=2810308 RepID=UPI001A97AC5F|nr:SusC/RagA family TonB-linked outer membrane protein [Pedobacter sp. SYSU D00535]
MKYTKISKTILSLVALVPCLAQAQTDVQYNPSVAPDSATKVQVAFRKLDKKDVLGGVSSVNIADLMNKSYSTYSLDHLEAFAPGFHGNIWGNGAYLVLVDGIPRDAGNVLPTEIQEITVLKSAAASILYGSRAAKGVLLITTKRGQAGNQQVQIRANAGLHSVKRFPNYLGSAEYMTLYNEARQNDGISALYTNEQIYNHAAGTNPYRYPNVDMYSEEYLKSGYSRYDATMEVSGGNERARYYTNLGFYRQGSLLNFGEGQNNNTQRFNVRGNVDVDIIKQISSFIDASVSFNNQSNVNADYFGGAATLRPNRFSPLIPISMIEENDWTSQTYVNSGQLIDGKYLLGGSSLDQTNPIAAVYAGGSGNNISRQFQFTTGVNADLSGVLKGLSFHTTFGLDYSTSYRLAFSRQYATYNPVWNNYSGAELVSFSQKFGNDASTGNQDVSEPWFRQTSAINARLAYENQFLSKHNVSAMIVANGFQQSITGDYHRLSSANLGMNLGYNFRQTYYADFTGSVIHSAKLPEGNRRAFSPTLSLAWRLSNEGFMKSARFVNDLRLTASAGVMHTDIDISGGNSQGFYLYESSFRQTGNNLVYYTWRDGNTNYTAVQDRDANPNLKFPKREEITFGIDGTLFNRALAFNGTYFSSKMTGLIVQNASAYPSYFAPPFPATNFMPWENYNDELRTGFDLGLSYSRKLGQVDWRLGMSGTYFDTEILQLAEPIYNNIYQYRTGRPLNNIFGLQNLGFYKDQDDINNSPRSGFGEVKPGDIKYKDQNQDGVINVDDEVYLGRSTPPLTLGFNITAKYKGFSLFAVGLLRNGGLALKGSNFSSINPNYFWVNGEDKYSEIVRGRWTPETRETATYPRLTTQAGSNNFRTSDFWLYSTNRFDLARVQLSYTVTSPNDRSILNGLQIYANGMNLLSVAKNREILELNVGTAPQTRFFNFGVKGNF